MKRFLLLLLALILPLSLLACEEEEQPAPDVEISVLDLSVCYIEKQETVSEKTLFVQFEIEGGATFVVELLPQYAPETVENFQKLVAEDFYDGLTFHRIYKNFMIQGGCPNGDGTGTLDETIYGEFSANGFAQNTLLHERGVISMARRNTFNSASCQFFIMHAYTPSLDGKYAAFGRVVAGMETVDAIANVEVTMQDTMNERSKPLLPVVIKEAAFINYTAE